MKDSICYWSFAHAIYQEVDFIIDSSLRRSLDYHKSASLGSLSTLFDLISYLPLAIFFRFFLCLQSQHRCIVFSVHVTSVSIVIHMTMIFSILKELLN